MKLIPNKLTTQVRTGSDSDWVLMDVFNLQRKIKLNLAPIRAFVADLSESIPEAANKIFSVAFVSDNRMRQLNEMFRSKDSTTDVLSFPHEPDEFNCPSSPPYEGGGAAASADGVVLSGANFLGDIVISAEQAQKQAKENKLSLDAEIKQLILHGLLHLCGYDHETDNGEMNEREFTLRKNLRI